MTDHLQEMTSKLELLRRTGTPALMVERLERDESGIYNAPCLRLPPGVDLTSLVPNGISSLYLLSEHPRFGRISFRRWNNFENAKALDYSGESVYSGALLRVADAFENAILLDPNTGYVMVYDYLYFKYGLETGVILECEDLAEFVNTVALGFRYRDINGPSDVEDAWWLDDIWHHRLVELGMMEGV